MRESHAQCVRLDRSGVASFCYTCSMLQCNRSKLALFFRFARATNHCIPSNTHYYTVTKHVCTCTVKYLCYCQFSNESVIMLGLSRPVDF